VSRASAATRVTLVSISSKFTRSDVDKDKEKNWKKKEGLITILFTPERLNPFWIFAHFCLYLCMEISFTIIS